MRWLSGQAGLLLVLVYANAWLGMHSAPEQTTYRLPKTEISYIRESMANARDTWAAA